MPFGVVVLGPAGSGKSTFCYVLQNHFALKKRKCRIVNLDAAAEDFKYECDIDIRELIQVDDVMDEFEMGPNGGLMYAYEYVVDNFDWLEDKIGEFIDASSTYNDDEIFLFDCSGQIELFTHMNTMKILIEKIQQTLNFRLCTVYCIDVSFIHDTSKLIAGSFTALSAMINLELPHVNLLTKCDLVLGPGGEGEIEGSEGVPFIGINDIEKKFCVNSESEDSDNDDDDDENTDKEKNLKKRIVKKTVSHKLKGFWGGRIKSSTERCRWSERYNNKLNLCENGSIKNKYENIRETLEEIINTEPSDMIEKLDKYMPRRYKELNAALVNVLEDFNLVSYVILNNEDEESIIHVCNIVESLIQFDENQEVRENDYILGNNMENDASGDSGHFLGMT